MRLQYSAAVALLGLGFVGFAAERINYAPEDPASIKLSQYRFEELVEWCHPVYPPELKSAGVGGEIRVRYIVDAKGAITSLEAMPGDDRFKAAALAAVAKWKYTPLSINGQAEPVSLEVLITFRPTVRLGDPKTTALPYRISVPEKIPPEERRTPDPVYPKYLGKRHLFGDVEMNMAISKEGRVTAVEILRVTHPDFITAALAAVDRWKFQPARIGRLPAEGRKNSVLSFVVEDTETGAELRKDWLELNGVTLHVPGEPKSEDYFTKAPVALILVDPVYPAELRQRGVTGKARASFSIDQEGRVVNVAILEATEPAFGEALGAAVTAWAFQPLYHEGEKVFTDFFINWEFGPPPEGSPDERLLSLQASGVKPVGAAQLDKVPGVLFRRQPVYPAALLASRTAGQADVEVMIDHDGKVCLPRVVKATAPEFGWAAATAVSQWYFETPRKGGEPVDVRVVIPLVFKPD
jgi:TonB family protein